MTLHPNKITVVVADSDDSVRVFTDARAISVLSQDMDDWISYMAYKEFAQELTFSAGIHGEIAATLEYGASVHD